ncbi:MAG: LysE family transporter [Anaerolineae bacterium]|jgi:threonine/homoserine/homoserine lactone efflux protein
MTLPTFLLEAIAISLSGVMAPGPITSVVVGKGTQSPHAGALVAVGHGIVELPLMIAVFYGVGRLLKLPHTSAAIALGGGLFLLWMGLGMLRSLRRDAVQHTHSAHTPLVAGILLSAGNPYFLVWWATVGAALIARSIRFGVWGFLAFALAHWMCDLLWDYLLSALSFKGGQIFGARFQRGIYLLCGACLILFGGRFVIRGALHFLR